MKNEELFLRDIHVKVHVRVYAATLGSMLNIRDYEYNKGERQIFLPIYQFKMKPSIFVFEWDN